VLLIQFPFSSKWEEKAEQCKQLKVALGQLAVGPILQELVMEVHYDAN